MEIIPLESVRVAAPCHADWDRMQGDERARFCSSCEKHVYNLSGMTRGEAEALIQAHEGQLCVRFYRRADGTVLTDNCPVGLRKIRNAARRPLRWTGSILVMLLMPFATYAGAALLKSLNKNSDSTTGSGAIHLRQVQPFKAMQNVPPFDVILNAIDPDPIIYNVASQGALTTG